MKKKIFAAVSAVCICLGMGVMVPVGAMDIRYKVDDDGIMLFSGNDVSEDMAVNMQICDADSKETFLLEQVKGNADKKFSVEINLEKALPATGSYIIQSASQNGEQFNVSFSYCKKEDLIAIAGLLKAELQKQDKDRAGIIAILKDNSEILSKIDPIVQKAFENNLYEYCAILLSGENDITEDSIKSVIKKVCAVSCLSLDKTAADVKNIFDDYGTNIDISQIKEYPSLDDTGKAKLYERLAAVKKHDESMEGFYTTVYHNIILTKLDSVNGTGAIEEVLKKYGREFDFTVYNRADNDKNTVLVKIYSEFEDKSVKALEDVQKILNQYIPKSVKGGGSSSSSNGSSGGRSGAIGGGVNSGVDFSQTVSPSVNGFNDLDGYEWAQASIKKLNSLGVIKGVAEEKFAPGNNVTRAEFCTMMCRLFGQNELKEQTIFADVTADTWYFGYVNAMYNAGAVQGVGDGRFNPDAQITRQDASVIIHRAIEKFSERKLAEIENILFADNDAIADYASASVLILRGNGIVSGKDENRFEPDLNMNRAEAAQLMMNTYEFMEGVQ